MIDIIRKLIIGYWEYVIPTASIFGDEVLDKIVISSFSLYISYPIAFGIVGDLYRDKVISGRILGVIMHWSIRIPLTAGISHIAAFLITMFNILM